MMGVHILQPRWKEIFDMIPEMEKKPVAVATTVTPTSPAMVRGRIEGHVGG
jgi:hypothetical protein